MAFIKIIRPINLFVIAITQLSIYFFILRPDLNELRQSAFQGYGSVLLIVFTTILLAAGGYVINDVLDVKADKLNKPEKNHLQTITTSIARKYYFVLLCLGLCTALLITIIQANISYIILYLISAILLFFYSSTFKHKVLIGNIIIALFCALVPFILALSFMDEIINFSNENPDKAEWIKGILLFYILFAFQSTLLREMVKDIEDVKGDFAANSKTIATVYGIERASIFSIFNAILLLVLMLALFVFIWFYTENNYLIILGFTITTLPVIYVIYVLFSRPIFFATSASNALKSVMVTGLIYLIILSLC